MDSEECEVSNVQTFESRFTIKRVKERCSPHASEADKKLNIPLPSGFELLIGFGTNQPEKVDIRISTPAFQTLVYEKVELRLDLPMTGPIVSDFDSFDVKNNATYEDSQANLFCVNTVRFVEIKDVDRLMGSLTVKFSEKPPCLPVMRCGDMLRLYEEEIATDTEILVGETTFKAHKAVLMARCDYFRGLFESEFIEAKSGKIVIDDGDDVDAKIFEMLLKFLYSGNPPQEMDHFALKLLPLADRFGVEMLLKYCVFAIKQKCTPNLRDLDLGLVNLSDEEESNRDEWNFCRDALILADRHKIDDLKELLIEIMIEKDVAGLENGAPPFAKMDETLKKEFFDRLCAMERLESVDPDNVMRTLVAAEAFDLDDGKENCLKVMKNIIKNEREEFRGVWSQYFWKLSDTMRRNLIDVLVDESGSNLVQLDEEEEEEEEDNCLFSLIDLWFSQLRRAFDVKMYIVFEVRRRKGEEKEEEKKEEKRGVFLKISKV